MKSKNSDLKIKKPKSQGFLKWVSTALHLHRWKY